MYTLEELTDAEVKSIDLITRKIKYNDPDDINRVCEYLDNKNRIKSEPGKAYLDALRRMGTGKAEVTECIYCDNTLKENEHVICTECIRKMLSIKHNKNDNSGKDVTSGFKPNKKILVSAIIIIVLVLMIFGTVLIRGHYYNIKNSVEESVALDGIDFVGQSKDVTDSIFGQSVPLIMDNSIYYQSAGISVVYDVDTNIINYIDCDNKGTVGSIEIMGINIGWNRSELISYLEDIGYEGDIADDDTLTIRTRYNDKDVEIYVVLEEDEVTLICAYSI